jgi:hypothetical protein
MMFPPHVTGRHHRPSQRDSHPAIAAEYMHTERVQSAWTAGVFQHGFVKTAVTVHRQEPQILTLQANASRVAGSNTEGNLNHTPRSFKKKIFKRKLCGECISQTREYEIWRTDYRNRLALTIGLLSSTQNIPVTGRGDLQYCEMLSIPHCLDNRLTVNCEILAPYSSTYSQVRTSQEAHSVSIK